MFTFLHFVILFVYFVALVLLTLTALTCTRPFFPRLWGVFVARIGIQLGTWWNYNLHHPRSNIGVAKHWKCVCKHCWAHQGSQCPKMCQKEVAPIMYCTCATGYGSQIKKIPWVLRYYFSLHVRIVYEAICAVIDMYDFDLLHNKNTAWWHWNTARMFHFPWRWPWWRWHVNGMACYLCFMSKWVPKINFESWPLSNEGSGTLVG